MGFANGDIMFNMGLVETVKAVIKRFNTTEEILIMGGRLSHQYGNSTRNLSMSDMSDLRVSGPNTWAVDYYLISHNQFPWETIPDVVIGRPGYDNFIVGHCPQ